MLCAMCCVGRVLHVKPVLRRFRGRWFQVKTSATIEVHHVSVIILRSSTPHTKKNRFGRKREELPDEISHSLTVQ